MSPPLQATDVPFVWNLYFGLVDVIPIYLDCLMRVNRNGLYHNWLAVHFTSTSNSCETYFDCNLRLFNPPNAGIKAIV